MYSKDSKQLKFILLDSQSGWPWTGSDNFLGSGPHGFASKEDTLKFIGLSSCSPKKLSTQIGFIMVHGFSWIFQNFGKTASCRVPLDWFLPWKKWGVPVPIFPSSNLWDATGYGFFQSAHPNGSSWIAAGYWLCPMAIELCDLFFSPSHIHYSHWLNHYVWL